MDENFIYERLKALSGGLERSLYRDISKAFEEVVRYNERALSELRRAFIGSFGMCRSGSISMGPWLLPGMCR